MQDFSAELYASGKSTVPSEALLWLERQTHLRTNYPQMLSGTLQGEFLKILVSATGASRVLEIGTFSGYSAICLALGLPEGGRLDTLEKNDEMEDLIREGWRRAGVSDRITLHVGDALETLSGLPGPYDIVFIDADKRQYPEYFDAVIGKVRPGGLIVADDVLWDGKVCGEKIPTDPQTRGILAFNEKVALDPGVENVILPVRHGLSIIRKK